MICGAFLCAAQDPIVTEYPNDFRPDLIVHLYPEGQQVDRGIIEFNTQVTHGPGTANQTDTTEYYWLRDGSLTDISINKEPCSGTLLFSGSAGC